jgi:hypothetical protein
MTPNLPGNRHVRKIAEMSPVQVPDDNPTMQASVWPLALWMVCVSGVKSCSWRPHIPPSTRARRPGCPDPAGHSAAWPPMDSLAAAAGGQI